MAGTPTHAGCFHRFVQAPDGSTVCSKCGAVMPPVEVVPGPAGKRPLAKRIVSDRAFVLLAVLIGAVLAAIFLPKVLGRVPAPEPSAEKPQVINLAQEPEQTMLEKHTLLTKGQGFTLLALARYRICARVMEKSVNGGYGPTMKNIYPIDVALAWGDFAITDYDRYLEYEYLEDKNKTRTFWMASRDNTAPPIPFEYIGTHFSNNHVCPANENIYNAVARLKKKQDVIMEGYLARTTLYDSEPYDSSLTRGDDGPGACESFYVEKIQVGQEVYK